MVLAQTRHYGRTHIPEFTLIQRRRTQSRSLGEPRALPAWRETSREHVESKLDLDEWATRYQDELENGKIIVLGGDCRRHQDRGPRWDCYLT